jgi:hypothetical protein
MKSLNDILTEIEALSMERDSLMAQRQKQQIQREVQQLKMQLGGSSGLKEYVGAENYSMFQQKGIV